MTIDMALASITSLSDYVDKLELVSPWLLVLGIIVGLIAFLGGIALCALIVLAAVKPGIRRFIIGRTHGVSVPMPVYLAIGVPVFYFLILLLMNTMLSTAVPEKTTVSGLPVTAVREKDADSLSTTAVRLNGNAIPKLSHTLAESGETIPPDRVDVSASGVDMSTSRVAVSTNTPAANGSDSATSPRKVIASLITYELILLILCGILFAIAVSYGGTLRDFGLKSLLPPRHAIGWGFGVYGLSMGALFLIQLLSFIFFNALFNRELPQNEIIDITKNYPTLPVLAVVFFVTVIGAPLIEEFVFRGTIYPGLKSVIGGPAAAMASAAMFSLLHPMINWPAIFILGLLLVYLYERTGSLWANISLHAANNFVAMMVTFAQLGILTNGHSPLGFFFY